MILCHELAGTSEDDILSPFARSGKAENAPLIASPTSYSDQQNNVEDVMPPSIIEPTSVSELGEESSSNLGNIPEAKGETFCYRRFLLQILSKLADPGSEHSMFRKTLTSDRLHSLQKL